MSSHLDANQLNLQNESLNELEFNGLLQIAAKFASSELGSELILKSYPSNEIFWLRKEHNLIEEMTFIITEDDTLPLENLKDVRPLLHKSIVTNSILNPEEILSARDVFRTSRLIKNYFRTKSEQYPESFEEADLLTDNRLLEKHISDTIDESTGEVKSSASKELSRIRRDIQDKSSRLRGRINRIMKQVSEDDMLREDYVSIREGRFVLPVKIENKRMIPGIIHGVSHTGSTVFLEPSEIIEMNNEMSLLLNEEKREVYRILQNITSEIGASAKDFLRAVEILAHFDSVFGKARYALETGGIKPEIVDSPEIELNNIRHPLLVKSKGRKSVIPLSVNFSGKVRGHLISGPNAGGKTVALKSIGLNIAMALSGIYPLGTCRTNYRTIFTAIGDHQSILNDLSTFSSQIYRIKKIVDHCNNDSLVLIDEIGSGTDPQEGSALAAGILDGFLNINLFFVVTTHQSSLKSYALTRDEIENDSLEFNEEELKPTYNFLTGIPGNSYAFVLAEEIGIPKNILERAKGYVGEKQNEIEESIRVLQSARSEIEKLRREANIEKKKAEELKLKYDEKFKEIKAKRQSLMSDAREEAASVLNSANSLIERTIREIKEEKRTIADIKKDFNTEKTGLDKKVEQMKKESKKSRPLPKLTAGDTVTLEDSNNLGTILETDDENLTALVDFNGVKFRLPFEQLLKTKKKKTQSHNLSNSTSNIKFKSNMTIDLRGKRAEEALRETDDFISDAILSNTTPLTIIHGKGTGALRSAIRELLSAHPSVTSFRDGRIEEGGDGVTIVEI